LRRIGLGPLRLGTLPSGKARRLSKPEVDALRHVAQRRKRVPLLARPERAENDS